LVAIPQAQALLLELLPLGALVVVSVLIASETKGYLAFGAGTSPTIVILIMFAGVLLGLRRPMHLLPASEVFVVDFAEPLWVSPILLLPLIGSVQGAEDLQAMQMVSFALLAFQNGFFWQVVLERGQPKP
jgi:hypothetical protein